MEKKNNDDKPKIAVALEYTPGEQAPTRAGSRTQPR